MRRVFALSMVLVFVTGLGWAGEAFDLDSLLTTPSVPMAPRTSSRNPRIRHFSSAEEMHVEYTHDFASRPGFGKSRTLYLPPEDLLTQEGVRYRFQTPVLLGLDGESVAYISPGPLLTVDDLSGQKSASSRIQRRALSAMEKEAADRLRGGVDLVKTAREFDVVSDGKTNRVRGLFVVGALRVEAQCAACHQQPKGALLGALAYSLIPEPKQSDLAGWVPSGVAPTVRR